MEPLVTGLTLETLIERAAEVVGSQRKLAAVLEIYPSNLVEMKQGKRPCNWRIRGKMRAILGEDPARAFVAAMKEDLEASENEDEKKAADGLKAMLAAFPDDWRRLYQTDRLRWTSRAVIRLCLFIDKAFHNGVRYPKALGNSLQRV